MNALSSLSELVARRELLWNLTLREMRGRYKRSLLGWAWSMLNPLATMLIYWVVFGHFLDNKPPVGNPSGINNFAVWLLCGLLPWNFFAVSVSVGMGSIVANGGLVKKVAFPREHLVVSTVLASLLTFWIELGVLSVVLLILGNVVVIWIPMIVLTSMILSMFATGLALALSSANVYFRDVSYLWGIMSQGWFFLTPIVYPAALAEKQLPDWLFSIYDHLPLATAARMFRALMYDLRAPALTDFALLAAYGVVVLLAGWKLFTRLAGRFAEEL